MALNLEGLFALLLLMVASATVSTTLTKGSIFRALRLALKPSNKKQWLRNFFWKLASCPYCMSHWVGALALLVYPVLPISYLGGADYILSWLLLVFGSAMLSALMILAVGFSEDDAEPLFTMAEALEHFQELAKERTS